MSFVKISPLVHGRHYRRGPEIWLASCVMLYIKNLGKNGVSGVKEAPKLVWLGIRQLVWIPNKLILMSFVKISPLVPWDTLQEGL
jgi:hypothetical protein